MNAGCEHPERRDLTTTTRLQVGLVPYRLIGHNLFLVVLIVNFYSSKLLFLSVIKYKRQQQQQWSMLLYIKEKKRKPMKTRQVFLLKCLFYTHTFHYKHSELAGYFCVFLEAPPWRVQGRHTSTWASGILHT